MKQESASIKKTIMYILNHDPLLLLMGMVSVLGNLMAIIIVYVQPLMREVGFDLAYFGLIFALLTVIQALGGRVGTFLEKRIRPRNFAFIVIYFISFSYVIFAISFKPIMFLFSASMLSFFAGMLGPVWVVYVNKFIPSSKRATMTSFGSLLNSVIFIFFAPIFGLFTEALSMRFSIVMASIFSLLIIPILARKLGNRRIS